MRSTLIAAALPLLVAPLAAAPPATAAPCTSPELVNARVTPGTVVLGIADPKAFDITVAVRKRGCQVSSVDTDLFTATDFVDTLTLDELGTKDGVTTYQGGALVKPGGFADSDAGTFRTQVYLSWGSKNTNDDGPTFRLVRAARVSTNAAPEPVTRGRAITVTGALTRASWDTLRYRGYQDRKVRLQFRPSGGSYSTVRTATSGTGGALRTTVTATRDGCFRYVFAGSGTTAKVTGAPDCVDVR